MSDAAFTVIYIRSGSAFIECKDMMPGKSTYVGIYVCAADVHVHEYVMNFSQSSEGPGYCSHFM